MEATEFVVPLKPEYECPICLQCMQKPVQLEECGHRFCEACISKWMKEKGPGKNEDGSLCPTCLKRGKLYRDSGFERQILGLPAKCAHCSKSGELRELVSSNHFTNCEYRPVPCPEGCGLEVAKCNLETHREEDCSKRQTACSFCGKNILLSAYMLHMPECPRKSFATEEPAPTASNGVYESNDNRVVETQEPCPYVSVGCVKGKLNSVELKRHLDEDSTYHAQVRNRSFFLSRVCCYNSVI